MKKIIASIFLLSVLCFTGNAHAAAKTLTCDKVVSVGKIRGILYKNQNVHGGYGRTFLDRDHRFKATQRLIVAKKVVTKLDDGTEQITYPAISCFGLQACDTKAYGCRYYQHLCGDFTSNSVFIKRATTKAGKLAFVGTSKGTTCYSFPSDRSRFGSL